MNERLETFCDGVFAIAITLLILEIKVPPVNTIHSSLQLRQTLWEHWPSWFAFLLSFMSLFIAWVNHHHLMKQLRDDKTSNAFMYAHGLFILTIIIYPFITWLLAEYLNTEYNRFPVFAYCFMNTIHAAAWVLLCHCALHPIDLGSDAEQSNSIRTTGKSIMYTVAFNLCMSMLAFWFPILAVILTAMAWLIYLAMGVILTPVKTTNN